MIMISVFDKKSSSYQPPLTYDHVSHAIRSYVSFCRQKPEALQVQFADDFDLYEVAEWDQISGLIIPLTPPNFVESMRNISNESRRAVPNG